MPYLNLWVGLDRPQPLADDTGILKNTGINFETDALTGFPKLDDTGNDTYGGALGIQYLFELDKQLVFEVATVQILGDVNEKGRAAIDDQYGFGIRYQHPIGPAWIARADAMDAEVSAECGVLRRHAVRTHRAVDRLELLRRQVALF